MDPNQLPNPQNGGGQPASPQPSGSFNPNQYDFITDPAKAPKKTLLPSGSGSSKKQRIIIFSVGMVLLFILLIIGFNFATSGSRPNTAQLTAVLQQQQEIMRVSDTGSNKASGEEAKNIAATTKVVITSQNLELKNILAAKKIKVNSKLLDDAKNAETDATLKTAEQNGRYDDAFIQQTRTSLEEYRKTIKTAYNGSNSQAIKEELNEDYKQVNILLEEITGQPQT